VSAKVARPNEAPVRRDRRRAKDGSAPPADSTLALLVLTPGSDRHISTADMNELSAGLLARFRRGDDDAFEAIFREYSTQLCTFALHFTRSRDLAAEIARVYRQTLGENHPGTLIVMNNLSIYLRGSGEPDRATTVAATTHEGLTRRLGPAHPFTLSAAINLANCLGEQGRHEEAERLERRTLEALRAKLGDLHPDTLACEANLAVTLRSSGRVAEAERVRERLLPLLGRVLGDSHPNLIHLGEWRRINRDLEPQPF